MTEKLKEAILGVFGYTPNDLSCSNATTAISVMFEDEQDSNPETMIELFLINCDEIKFKELKQLVS